VTREDFISQIKSLNIYFDEDHPDHIEEKKVESLQPPFLEFEFNEDEIRADGINYLEIQRVNLRLYSDSFTEQAEDTLEGFFINNMFGFNKAKRFDSQIDLYETDYDLTI